METQVEEVRIVGPAILEVFGHRRLVGYVREDVIGGAKLIRIDVPGFGDACQGCRGVGHRVLDRWSRPNRTEPCAACEGTGKTKGAPEPAIIGTQFYGTAAIFSLTPCSEAAMRAALWENRSSDPVRLMLPAAHGADDVPAEVDFGERECPAAESELGIQEEDQGDDPDPFAPDPTTPGTSEEGAAIADNPNTQEISF